MGPKQLFSWLVFWTTLLALNPLGSILFSGYQYLSADTAETVYHVRELAMGRIPYRDIFTHHFAGYLLPLHLLNKLVEIDGSIIFLLSLAYNFANTALIFLVLRSLFGTATGMRGAVLGVTVGWFWAWQGMVFNIQSFCLPFLHLFLLALVLTLKHRSFNWLLATSFFFGFLIPFDQRLIFFAALLLLPFIHTPGFRHLRTYLLTISAALLTPAVYLAYLGYNKALPELFKQTIIFPLFFRNAGQTDPFFTIALKLIKYLAFSQPTITCLCLIALVSLLKFDSRAWLKQLVLAVLGAGLLYAISGGGAATNYLLILWPPAIFLLSVLPHFMRHLGTSLRVAAIAILALLALEYPLLTVRYRLQNGQWTYPVDERTFDEAAEFVRANSEDHSDILVWGYAPQIYLFSNRLTNFRDMGLISVSGMTTNGSHTDGKGVVPEMLQEFDKYMRESPPLIFVDYRPHARTCGVYPKACAKAHLDYRLIPLLESMESRIQRDYVLARTIRHENDSADVYLLKNRERDESHFSQ